MYKEETNSEIRIADHGLASSAAGFTPPSGRNYDYLRDVADAIADAAGAADYLHGVNSPRDWPG